MKKIYQIKSGLGGALSKELFGEVFEVQKMCLNFLIKSLYDRGYVEDLAFAEFQGRLEVGLDEYRREFESMVCDSEEVHGDFFCELEWPTSTKPQDFSGVFEAASNMSYVNDVTESKFPDFHYIQIQLWDGDNWLMFENGGLVDQEGFMDSCWINI